jgi:glycosyltransferase involved in cell wall biosynthesis
LLREKGHDVDAFTAHNKDAVSGTLAKARAFVLGAGNRDAARRFRKRLLRNRPEVIHIHNLFPLLSPSIVDVAFDLGIPTCMTIHNYRFTCPENHHFKDGKVCTECKYGSYWPCVINHCGGFLEGMGFAFWAWSASYVHKLREKLDDYVVLNRFQQDLLIEAGFKANKIFEIPNMISRGDLVDSAQTPGQYVAFVGRISQEKGIDVLVAAARITPDVQYRITATNEELASFNCPPNIVPVGWLDKKGIDALYREAICIVLPSLWFEGQPMCIIEAAARGIPAIVSDLGGMADMVEDQRTGLTFPPGDATALAKAVRSLSDPPQTAKRLGANAHKKCKQEYAEESHYRKLVSMYSALVDGERTAMSSLEGGAGE